MNITDKMLVAAAGEARDVLLLTLPNSADCHHEFSLSFERKMQPLLKRKTHHPMGRMVQRAAAIFLAGLVGVSTWLAVDTQARAAFFRWCKEIYETYVVYHFSGNDPMQTSVYRPGWLPIGYEETSALSVPGFNQMVFQNQEGNQILFDYTLMQQGAVAAVVPETAILKAVEINDCYGELYLEGDPERASVLMWFDDQENLAFSLSACLPEDDILHIAQSILLS